MPRLGGRRIKVKGSKPDELTNVVDSYINSHLCLQRGSADFLVLDFLKWPRMVLRTIRGVEK